MSSQPAFSGRKESTFMPHSDDPRRSVSRPKDPVVYTVQQFCADHQISKSKLYELFGTGDGPAAVRVGRRVLITAEAAKAWRQKLTDRSEQRP
jgi:hypothetical protein